jgi:carboxymethylenebutenolidase
MSNRRAALLALVAITTSLACAGAKPEPTASSAPPAAPTPNEALTTIPLKGAQGDGIGYLAVPPGGGKHGTVIVIQEWWGVTPWIRDVVQRFAKNGYVALAVDLYRGKVTNDPKEAAELKKSLPDARALADLEAGFDALAARDDVDPAKIGAVGWCMGGGFALKLAIAEPRLRAAVVNYGEVITDPAPLRGVHAELLGNFGGADPHLNPDVVHAFEAALKDAGKSADVKIYDGKQHAFMNPGNAKGYDAIAAADAWVRIDAFFAKTLK